MTTTGNIQPERSGIWVIGATFGAYYARALAGAGLTAIVGRGGAAGRVLAQSLNCTYFSSVGAALEGPLPAVAVVVVRGTIVGGAGDCIARQLLEAGIPVLQELPVHSNEMAITLKTALRNKVCFEVTAFYDAMPVVRHFTCAAQRLVAITPIRSVEVRVSVQTLHCALFVLSDLLGGPLPSLVTAVPMASEEKVLIGSVWHGVAVDIVLMNRLDPLAPDDNSQPLMQITLLSDEGELTLHSPFGQVIWERRLHQSSTIMPALAPDTTCLDEPPVMTGPPLSTYQGWSFAEHMTEAIRTSVTRFMASGLEETSRLQRQLAVLQVWQSMCAQAGHPLERKTVPTHPVGAQLMQDMQDIKEEEACVPLPR